MTDRDHRRRAAAKYRPDTVDLLLVAEAPPKAPDRYFYFEEVADHDWLFRYVCKVRFGLSGLPARYEKRSYLGQLRDAGIFLIDLSEEPMNGVGLEAHAPRLVDRCRAIDPRRIVLIKVSVYETALEPLRSGGLPVVDERIPFPSTGQQPRFETAFARALEMQ